MYWALYHEKIKTQISYIKHCFFIVFQNIFTDFYFHLRRFHLDEDLNVIFQEKTKNQK